MNILSHNFVKKNTKKVAPLFLIISLLSFSSPYVFAANPSQPFSPSDNVLDPGCLPTDSNCYVSISNLTLNNATTTSLSVLANALITGNLGVGTTSPNTSNLLHLWSNSTGQPLLLIENTQSSNLAGMVLKNSYQQWVIRNNGVNASNLEFRDGTLGSTKMVISTSGNIGIGTTTPSAKLAIAGTSGTNPFTVASSTGSTLFTILQNGNVGIGKNNPLALLDLTSTDQSNSGAGVILTNGLVQTDGLQDLTTGAPVYITTSGGTSYAVNTNHRGTIVYPGDSGIIGTGGPTTRTEANRWTTFGAGASLTVDIGRALPIASISWGTYWRSLADIQMQNYSIDYSDDNLVWTNAITVTNNTKPVVHYFSQPFTARYVRVTSTDGTGDMSSLQILGYNVQSPYVGGEWGTSASGWGGTFFGNAILRTTGGVGIGTTTVNNKLTVDDFGSGTLGVAVFQNSIAAATNTASQILFGANRSGNIMTNLSGISGIVTDITSGAYKGALGFYTANNSAPTEKMRLDELGNLGIGTTTPSAKLAITGTSGTNPFTVASSTGSTFFTVLENGNVGVGTSSPSSRLSVSTTGLTQTPSFSIFGDTNQSANLFEIYKGQTLSGVMDTGGSMRIAGRYQLLENGSSTAVVQALYSESGSNHLLLRAGPIANRITIKASDLSTIAGFDGANHSFTVASDGSYYVGVANPSGLVVQGNVGIGTSSPAYKLHVGDTSISGVVARFENSTGYCDINPTTTSLTCTSDINLKKNITTLDASTTLANLSQLNAVTYNWLSEDNASSTHAGFIAQEVQPLFPDLVATDANGTLSVSYGGFIPYIIQSIKSLVATVTNFRDSFTTKNLCVGEGEQKTCITREQLDTMIRQSGQAVIPQPVTAPVVTDSNTTTDTSTSTSTSAGDGVATTTEQVTGGMETAQGEATSTLPTGNTVTPPTDETFPVATSTDILIPSNS